MASCLGNSTCVMCAKTKIKCDKMQPCGRCTRLGLECSAQIRGRGRPPLSLPRPPTLNKISSRQIPNPPATTEVPMATRKTGQRITPQPRYMLIEAIKSAMMEYATSVSSPTARLKTNAVARWLLHVACCTGYEALHDDIAEFSETLDLEDDVVCADFKTRKPLSAEAKSSIQVPDFVASLNSGGSAFLVQASIKGAAVFLSNDDMATKFLSAAEAENVYAESFADPDAVMRRIVLGTDRATYLKAMADMIVKTPDLESETSVVVHVRGRGTLDPVLCLVQMRSAFSAEGDNVVFGTKFIPIPSSDYLAMNGPAAPTSAISLSLGNVGCAQGTSPAPEPETEPTSGSSETSEESEVESETEGDGDDEDYVQESTREFVSLGQPVNRIGTRAGQTNGPAYSSPLDIGTFHREGVRNEKQPSFWEQHLVDSHDSSAPSPTPKRKASVPSSPAHLAGPRTTSIMSHDQNRKKAMQSHYSDSLSDYPGNFEKMTLSSSSLSSSSSTDFLLDVDLFDGAFDGLLDSTSSLTSDHLSLPLGPNEV